MPQAPTSASLGTTAEGDLDEAHYAELLADGKVKIVAMTGCSNVLGTVTPVKRLAKMAHDAGALFVLDGAQIMRHGVVDITDLGVDYLAFSGHKMMAGTGIGALCGTRDALEMLAPRDFGGEMVGKVTQALTTWEELPLRLEAGTPNYVGAIALGAACDYLCALGREEIAAYESELVDHAASVLGENRGPTSQARRRSAQVSCRSRSTTCIRSTCARSSTRAVSPCAAATTARSLCSIGWERAAWRDCRRHSTTHPPRLTTLRSR